MANTTETKKARAKSGTAKGRGSSSSKGADAARAKGVKEGPPRQPGVERRRNHPIRAKHGHVHLILTQTMPHLGQAGDLVKVRPGFARNYLVPQGLATFATQANLRMVEKHRQRQRELEAARRTDLQNLSAQIAQRSLTIEANANAEGHLYGSVNAEQIAAALKAEGFPIEPDNVRIEGPLKELGLYSIKLHLAQDIDSEVKLWVVPTHTDETAS
ncbi:MAG: 50S ribosomal protein L9 [Isosphaeraceae bacterium]